MPFLIRYECLPLPCSGYLCIYIIWLMAVATQPATERSPSIIGQWLLYGLPCPHWVLPSNGSMVGYCEPNSLSRLADDCGIIAAYANSSAYICNHTCMLLGIFCGSKLPWSAYPSTARALSSAETSTKPSSSLPLKT